MTCNANITDKLKESGQKIYGVWLQHWCYNIMKEWGENNDVRTYLLQFFSGIKGLKDESRSNHKIDGAWLPGEGTSFICLKDSPIIPVSDFISFLWG